MNKTVKCSFCKSDFISANFHTGKREVNCCLGEDCKKKLNDLMPEIRKEFNENNPVTKS